VAKRNSKDPHNDAEWIDELTAAAEAAFRLRTKGSLIRPTCLCGGCVLIQMHEWRAFEKATKGLTGWRGNLG